MPWLLSAIPGIASLLGSIFGSVGQANDQNNYANFQNQQNQARWTVDRPILNRSLNNNALLSGVWKGLVTDKNNPLKFEKGLSSSLMDPNSQVSKNFAQETAPINLPTSFPGGIYPGANIPDIIGGALNNLGKTAPVFPGQSTGTSPSGPSSYGGPLGPGTGPAGASGGPGYGALYGTEGAPTPSTDPASSEISDVESQDLH